MRTGMQCMVVYDISDDKRRSKIADACLDYGLDRIQYSAFLGPLLSSQQDELMLRVSRILGKAAGNIQLFPLCDRDWRNRRIVGRPLGQQQSGGSDAG